MKKQSPNRIKPARPGIQLLAAALLWVLAFALCLRFGESRLVLFYEVPPGATGREVIFSHEGIARIAESGMSEDGTELSVSLEPVSRGVTEMTLRWDGLDSDSLYEREITCRICSLPFGVLFDSITWNFSGWEYFTSCLSFFFLTAALIFYNASRREKSRVFFSYRATAELGGAIFFLVTGLLRIDMLLSFLRGENAGTVWSLLVSTIVTAQVFMRQTAVVIVGFALVAAVSNLALMRHEGIRPSNMLGIAASLFMVGGAAAGIWVSRSLLTFPLRNVLLNVYAGLFVYLECILAAAIIRAIEAGRHEPAYDQDFVLVLGCGIRPDGSLYPLIQKRVDRAIGFVNAQLKATGKRATLVPSGGRGDDEPMAEAEAMARYMRQQGIPDEYILPETQSKTTRENILFSRDLLGEREKDARVAFSTSSYHVYRGGILAAEEGWNIDGMGSRTKWYFWPNAFLREFVGLMAAEKMRQLAAAAVITAASVGLTLLVM